MNEKLDALERALRLEHQLRSHLTELAAATDARLPACLDAVDRSLQELEELQGETHPSLRWSADAATRLSICRREVRRLREGESGRRDVIAKIRLIMPRFSPDIEDSREQPEN